MEGHASLTSGIMGLLFCDVSMFAFSVGRILARKLGASASIRSCSSGVMLLPADRAPYKGVKVNVGRYLKDVAPCCSAAQFSEVLRASLAAWRAAGSRAVWMSLDISRGDLMSAAAEQGFVFHHAEGKSATLVSWLPDDQPNSVPLYATHQVGVGGIVLDGRGNVLTIQEKNAGHSHWKFPGGRSDKGEDIGATATREVFEETGIKAEFQGLVAFRHTHHAPFGTSDIYFLCRMKALSTQIQQDTKEIAAAVWMPIEEFLTPKVYILSRVALCLALGRPLPAEYTVPSANPSHPSSCMVEAELTSILNPAHTFKLYHCVPELK